MHITTRHTRLKACATGLCHIGDVEQLALSWEPVRKTYTVQELNARIKGLLEGEFDDIWVASEISGCKTAASGHCYFTLKDREAQVRCVCFRMSLPYLNF